MSARRRFPAWLLILLPAAAAVSAAPAADRDRNIGELAARLRVQPEHEESQRELRRLLRLGFPLVADTATLDTLQHTLFDDSWQRKEFEVPAIPGRPATPACLTSGLLFTPQVPMRDPVRARLAPEALTNSFRFNRACYVYVQEEKAWRLRIRLYYVSASLIERDLAPTVEQLAQAFAQVYVIGRDAFGLRPRYTNDETVTVWVTDGGPARLEQRASAPGHLLFYSSLAARAALEWLREVAHEYGHVSLPPFGGFARAEEPYATGLIGEALLLGQLSECASVLGFLAPADELRMLVARRRQAAMEVFTREGPRSRLTDDMTDAGASYVMAFLVRLATSHGRAAVRDILNAFSESAAPVRTAELFTAYEQWNRRAARVELTEAMTVSETNPGVHWVYAPTLRMTVTLNLSCEANAAGSISFLSGSTRVVQEGFVINAAAAKEFTLSALLPRPGWYQLQVNAGAAPKPITINRLALIRGGDGS